MSKDDTDGKKGGGKKKPALPRLTEKRVSAWLEKRPEFLLRHQHLLPDGKPESDKILSFEQYGYARLRRELDKLEQKHRLLIENSKQNSQLAENVMALVEKLVSARTENDLKDKLSKYSEQLLHLQGVLVLDFKPEWAASLRLRLKRRHKGIYYGELDEKLAESVFGHPVGSVVMRLLPEGGVPGILTFASDDPEVFDRRERMGSLFIDHLAAVVRARMMLGWGGPRRHKSTDNN